jgi:hypothetical protein
MAVVASVIDAASAGSTSVAACRASAATGSGSVVVAAGRASESSAAPCEPPLAAVAVLAAARDSLDDRRLVGTAASVLSTLAGARGAWWAPPCEHEGERVRP